MRGQREILHLLAGPDASFTQSDLILDMHDPDQFERGYEIAMSMPDCYTTESYYRDTYRQIQEAYLAKNPRLMHEALTSLIIDILYR